MCPLSKHLGPVSLSAPWDSGCSTEHIICQSHNHTKGCSKLILSSWLLAHGITPSEVVGIEPDQISPRPVPALLYYHPCPCSFIFCFVFHPVHAGDLILLSLPGKCALGVKVMAEFVLQISPLHTSPILFSKHQCQSQRRKQLAPSWEGIPVNTTLSSAQRRMTGKAQGPWDPVSGPWGLVPAAYPELRRVPTT